MDYAFEEDGYSHIDQFMNWTIKYFFIRHTQFTFFWIWQKLSASINAWFLSNFLDISFDF